MRLDLDARLQSLKPETLAPLVRQSLNQPDLTLSEWQTARIQASSFGIVYRLTGTALHAGQSIPWSLILKVVHNSDDAPIDRSNPANIRYWKREPLVYQSGLLDDLPGNLVAPRSFGVVEQGGDEIWLWLEDIASADDPAADNAPWSPDQYALTARHLGQFNGGFLTNRPLPNDPCFSRRLLHAQFAEAEAFVADLPAKLDQPLAQTLLPPDVTEGLFRLWAARSTILKVVEALPQTVCHRDTYRINLFSRRRADGTPYTIAIDWEDVAIGPVGEDIVSPIILGTALGDIKLAGVEEFEAQVFESYLDGLRDSGWNPNSQQVRLGYTIAMLRYALGLPMMFLPRVTKKAQGDTSEQEALAAQWGAVLQFIYTRLDEAYRLMRDLRI